MRKRKYVKYMISCGVLVCAAVFTWLVCRKKSSEEPPVPVAVVREETPVAPAEVPTPPDLRPDPALGITLADLDKLILPSSESRWRWDELRDRYPRTEEARPYVERMKRKFEGVETLKITARTYLREAIEDLPKSTSLNTTYLITLRPFRVFERTIPQPGSPFPITGRPRVSAEEREKHQQYERIKITTPFAQYIRITDAEGTTEETKTDMSPDPLLHGGLPGIEPTFALWDSYGASLSEQKGERPSMRMRGKYTRNLPCVAIENIIGKTIICEWPADDPHPLAGNLLTRGVVTWRLFEGFREEQVSIWRVYEDKGIAIALPQDFDTWYIDPYGENPRNVSGTEFSRVEYNVPIDESVFTFTVQTK